MAENPQENSQGAGPRSRLVQRGEFVYDLPKSGSMKVPVTLFLSRDLLEQVDGDALGQIADAACLDEDSFVFATPDIHTGYGIPIGSVLATLREITLAILFISSI